MLFPDSSPAVNPQLRLYDQLLLFPLFLGMSRADLLQLVGHTRFDFRKFDAGQVVVNEGDTCSNLYFLIQGKILLSHFSDDRSYRVEETLSSPWMIEPEQLFGLSTRYTMRVCAETPCHFILLSKEEVLRLLDSFLTLRLNYLNFLSTTIQQRTHRFWRRTPRSLEGRIIQFLIDHCVYPAGPKTFYMLMRQLADSLNDSRLNVSKALNDMQEKGLLQLHRGRILIPSLEQLFV